MSSYLPDPVVKRLPMYYRYLKKLEREGREYISSAALAQLAGLTASQVRQDMNLFGAEGRQGCGYPVMETRRHIGKLLGMHEQRRMMIVGVGNLGRAIMRHDSFSRNGFRIVAAFDNHPQKVGMQLGTMTVRSCNEMESFLKKEGADIATLTLPATCAQEMAERLYGLGVRGFWNFAPVDLHLPEDASIVNVHLDESLELLSYRLCHPLGW